MPSTAETALQALLGVLQTVPGAQVERNLDPPEDVPAGGLLVLRDGDPGEPDIVLSPVTYYYQHTAEVEVYAKGPQASRDAAFDSLLLDVSAVVLADQTLSGAVDYLDIGRPRDVDTEGFEGAAGIKHGTVPVILHYSTTNPLN